MSDLKKRKVNVLTERSGSVFGAGATKLQPPKQPRSKKINVARGTGSSSSSSSVFAALKASMLTQVNEEVNEELQSLWPKCTSETQRYNLATASLAKVQQAKQLYGRTPGTLIAMGSDDMNQLALSSDADADKLDEYLPTECLNAPPDVVEARGGGVHSVALTNSGEVYTWGANDDGSLGRKAEGDLGEILPGKVTEGFEPMDKDQIVSTDTGDAHVVFLSIRGNVYSAGMMKDCDSGKYRDSPAGGDPTDVKGINRIPTKVQGLGGKVRMLRSGASFNAALREDGSVVTWGKFIHRHPLFVSYISASICFIESHTRLMSFLLQS